MCQTGQTDGAWSRIFNKPNLQKFTEPTVSGVDFPRVALSEARWDGQCLHLAAHPQNADVAGTRTSLTVSNLDPSTNWMLVDADGNNSNLQVGANGATIEVVVNNQPVAVRRG